MKEQLLQFIWNLKRFDHSNLTLSDGRKLIINHHGFYNQNENGPDFFNARITIDSVVWHGHIEIHVNSSAWFQHKHHRDSTFKNVILHVVWENDMDILNDGEVLPVLELKNRVSPSLLANYKSLKIQSNNIPCSKLLSSIPNVYKQQMIDSSLVNRFQRKIKGFSQLTEEEIIYKLLAKSIGGKVNQFSFEYITEQLPYSFLRALPTIQRGITIQSFGNILVQNSSSIQGNFAPMFKRKGMRPASRPENRIGQFSRIIPIIEFIVDCVNLESKEFIFLFRRKISELDRTISFDLQNNILINTIVPYFFHLGRIHENYKLKAIEILLILPAEKNVLVQRMKDLGFSCTNSFESQALLEIYNEFCTQKKCLNCSVGAKILNS